MGIFNFSGNSKYIRLWIMNKLNIYIIKFILNIWIKILGKYFIIIKELIIKIL